MMHEEHIEGVSLLNELKKEFEITVVQELLPGILHNFANPLNGIMGRSKLLQKRAHDLFQINGSADCVDGLTSASTNTEKIIRDIDLIAKETDRLFDLFNDVAGKVYRLQDSSLQKINISHLIKCEMAFFNFYLNFKHTIEKELRLDWEIPDITGIPADYSMAVSTILRYSMNAMKMSPVKRLVVTTCHDSNCVHVIFEDTGVHDIDKEEKELLATMAATHEPFYHLDGKSGLFNALSLLKKYDVHIDVDSTSDDYSLSIRIPC